MSSIALELTAMAAYVVLVLVTWFGLRVEIEYRRLQSTGYVDDSHVFFMSVFWPIALLVLLIVVMCERFGPAIARLPTTPSRVARVLHGHDAKMYLEKHRTP